MDALTTPTEAEIAALPRWAKVAFAARCARRVLPLVKTFCPAAPASVLKVFEDAVEIAESAAARATLPADQRGTNQIVSGAIRAGEAIRPTGTSQTAYSAAQITYNAAVVAMMPPVGAPGATPLVFAVATLTKTALAKCSRTEGLSTLVDADIDRLAASARLDRWTDNTPVAPDFFGSLWPDRFATSLPAVAAGTAWLTRLMGEHAPRALLRWSLDYSSDWGEVPSGLSFRLEMPEWKVGAGNSATWAQAADAHYLNGLLAGAWSDILKARIRDVRDEAGLVRSA